MKVLELQKGYHVRLTNIPKKGLECDVAGKKQLMIENGDFAKCGLEDLPGKENALMTTSRGCWCRDCDPAGRLRRVAAGLRPADFPGRPEARRHTPQAAPVDLAHIPEMSYDAPAGVPRPAVGLVREDRRWRSWKCGGWSSIYGRRKVVDGVNFEVNAGEVVGLLGPNGAGKTTSFRMTTGQITPNDGQVLFNGQDVTSLPMYQRARLGMGYLSQETSVFRKLTVEQNILAILEVDAGAAQPRPQAQPRGTPGSAPTRCWSSSA